MTAIDCLHTRQHSATASGPVRGVARSEADSPTVAIVTCGLDSGFRPPLESLLESFGFRVIAHESRKSAMETLRAGTVPVAVCAECFPDGDWRQFLRDTRSLCRPPAFVVVGDPSISGDVLKAGGFDVLSPPCREDEVRWTIAAAWHAWMGE